MIGDPPGIADTRINRTASPLQEFVLDKGLSTVSRCLLSVSPTHAVHGPRTRHLLQTWFILHPWFSLQIMKSLRIETKPFKNTVVLWHMRQYREHHLVNQLLLGWILIQAPESGKSARASGSMNCWLYDIGRPLSIQSLSFLFEINVLILMLSVCRED